MNHLDSLKPENVFRYFREIAAIPHGSYHTREISDYLVEFAKAHDLEYYQDDSDNVIIIKEASAGYENAEPVIIQGHMDMVCEQEAGMHKDFEKEGLDLYVDGDFLKAKGTTLGGDDGIAVAYALAILEDAQLAHPRLEVVLTSDEEVGLLGANAVDLSMLKGHILLNIDSDEEGHFLTSCAGGMTTHVHIPVAYQINTGVLCALKVHGLLGGHSGGEIHKERANASILMGRILKYAQERSEFGIVSLEGGLKDNAIPRECDCTVLVPEEGMEVFEQICTEITEIVKKEYITSDPGLQISIEKKGVQEAEILNFASLQKVLFLLRHIPNGVMHRSMDIEGLVETSLNAGIMRLEKEEFYLCDSVRSSISSRKEELADKIRSLCEFLGGEFEIQGDYPAWEYKHTSAIREKVKEVYQKTTGEEPVFEAIHAGLECGILSGKIPNLDAVSFGPDNFDIHTPQERMRISSVQKIYEFLIALLKSMK